MEKQQDIKSNFRKLERNVLILTGLPLPLFAFAYLYTTSRSMEIDLPSFPGIFDALMMGMVVGLLVVQWLQFHRGIKKTRISTASLDEKLKNYEVLTISRFWKLFAIGMMCAAGLLFYENPGYTIAYAVTLIYVSLGKPTPDRIAKLLRLKGDEKDLVYTINQRE
ncbi:hypothetical protein [Anditalea andensis]|uniref:Uncharacterized protein n=1 Tax=Anditalea andensis TaxID=1048983 RepID=A0A074L411_9BACT|nr:hypothetical protein [Anditalea andensis]KEO75170.1 hypothetical protein EL17_05740 [Anditalea andensis]